MFEVIEFEVYNSIKEKSAKYLDIRSSNAALALGYPALALEHLYADGWEYVSHNVLMRATSFEAAAMWQWSYQTK